MISCPRVLHQWVRGRRPPIFVAAGAVKIPSTSRKVFVHHVAMAPLQECLGEEPVGAGVDGGEGKTEKGGL